MLFMKSTFSSTSEKILRWTLVSLLFLLAFSAFGGGIYGMTGAKDLPDEWLKGSLFPNYFIPAFILFVFVGGSALFAGISILRRHRASLKASFICGAIIIFWIIAQLSIIGYVSWLQPMILIAGIFIFILTYLLSKYEH